MKSRKWWMPCAPLDCESLGTTPKRRQPRLRTHMETDPAPNPAAPTHGESGVASAAPCSRSSAREAAQICQNYIEIL